MTTLKERVLKEAAAGYIKASRIDEAAPPGKVDDYARWLYHERNSLPDPTQDIVVEVRLPLRDVFEIIHAIEDAAYFKDQYEKTWEAQNTWIAAFNSARKIMKDVRIGDWPKRSRKAIRALNLSSKEKSKKHDYPRIKGRYYQLIEGDYDPKTKTHHPPLSKSLVIRQMAEELGMSESTCVRTLNRAGVRNLPRIDE